MKKVLIGILGVILILAITAIPAKADDKVIVNLGVITGIGNLVRAEQDTMFMAGLGYRVDAEEFLDEMPFSFVDFNVNFLPFKAVDFEGKFGWLLSEKFYISAGVGIVVRESYSKKAVFLANLGWKFRTVFSRGAADPFAIVIVERGIDWGLEIGIKGKKAIHFSLSFYF